MKEKKLTYKCPRCGNTATPAVKPKALWCENYEGHHSNRAYDMVPVVDTDDSNKAD